MKTKFILVLLALAILSCNCNPLHATPATVPESVVMANSADYRNHVVMLKRFFTEEEIAAEPSGSTGVQGTASFISSSCLITIAHVVDYPVLSKTDWAKFTIEYIDKNGAEKTKKIHLRLLEEIKCHGENVVALELAEPIVDSVISHFETPKIKENDPVFVVAYSHGILRTGEGKYIGFAKETIEGRQTKDFELYELYDGDDRLAIDHGSSGGLIFDTAGNPVAILSEIVTHGLKILQNNVRTSTAWGQASHQAVLLPIERLKELSK